MTTSAKQTGERTTVGATEIYEGAVNRDSKGRTLCEMCLVANGVNKLAKWKSHIKNKQDGTEEYILRCDDHQEDLEDDDTIEVLNLWEENRP